jgi:predicted regulator of Ras-like GTPase activity (Roadblock/LC7/MglB family)
MGYAVSVGWAEQPLTRFVDDARVQLAVLMHPSGQVLAQVGFQRSLDVQTACALSAAINATAGQLGRMIDDTPFRGLHYAGQERQVYLGRLVVRGSEMVLLAVFDTESSLGIVQLYLEELQANVAAAAPPPEPATPALAEDFERDLNRNLSQLFGRAG